MGKLLLLAGKTLMPERNSLTRPSEIWKLNDLAAFRIKPAIMTAA